MKPKDKIIGGGGSISYSSHVWLCRCKKCNMNFFSKETRIVCESCITIEKRDDKIDDLLNNNIKS